jgi:hypothetical protein
MITGRPVSGSGREGVGVLWFLLSVLGFVALTAAVIAMARSDTARWEREKAVRAHAPAHRHPAGTVPHARRRRVEFAAVRPPAARVAAPAESGPGESGPGVSGPRAPLPVGADSADGSSTQVVP